LKPSPGIFFVASMSGLLPLDIPHVMEIAKNSGWKSHHRLARLKFLSFPPVKG
jgi:hypothetical protein